MKYHSLRPKAATTNGSQCWNKFLGILPTEEGKGGQSRAGPQTHEANNICARSLMFIHFSSPIPWSNIKFGSICSILSSSTSLKQKARTAFQILRHERAFSIGLKINIYLVWLALIPAWFRFHIRGAVGGFDIWDEKLGGAPGDLRF
jgi:hypothetical protein